MVIAILIILLFLSLFFWLGFLGILANIEKKLDKMLEAMNIDPPK